MTQLPYTQWTPALKAEDIFKGLISFSYVQAAGGDVFWIESRPSEQGRSVLVWRNAEGVVRDLTPPPFSARTRVNEYGARPYICHGSSIYFSNMSDQRLYRARLDRLGEITPLTVAKNADGSLGKYSEPTVSPDGRWLVCVHEREVSQGENPTTLAILDLQTAGEQEPRTLVQGSDFYRAPRFSPDGRRLAWLEWSHPFMPWDSTRLKVAGFEGGATRDERRIAGADDSSIPDFCFLDDGTIYYSQDFAGQPEDDPKNFAGLHRFDGAVKAITQTREDFQSIMPAGKELLVVSEIKGEPSLVFLDPETGRRRKLGATDVDFSVPACGAEGRVFVVANPIDRPAELVVFERDGRREVIRRAAEFALSPSTVSHPQLIEFPTGDGHERSYGYFYPPVNPAFQAPAGARPPVRVIAHGGPVGRTSRAFGLARLYWTSQGFAIFDVNYRGSTGFGRRYRDAIKNGWGIIEIEDVAAGLAELRRRGLIGSEAVVSGGSAGGYTVQRLLTVHPEMFAAGASHFGIGNLVTLQKLTHKFESHYLEQLIGGTLETNLKEYEARSPIHHLDRLKAPMIIFQGTEDKVVPPENSREVARLLEKKGVLHEYREYEGEAHGFRRKENMIDALEREAAFFKRVLQSTSTP